MQADYNQLLTQMKKNLFLILALFLGFGSASAGNTLSVGDVTITPNGKAVMAIMASFEKTDFVGYQLDIELPVGVKAVGFANGFSGTDHAIADSNPTGNVFRAVVSSMKKNSIPSGDFILLEVTLQGDESLTVGNSLQGTVKGATFSDANNIGSDMSEVTFNVKVSKETLLDENSLVAPASSDSEVDIKVLRTIKANEWSTICLPFKLTADQWKAAFGDDAQLHRLKDYSMVGEDLVVNFKAALTGNLLANKPYIIKTSKDITEFTVKATITPANTKDPIENDDEEVIAYMQGTLKAGTAVPNENLFLNNNSFWYSTGATRIKAFRAYFWFEDVIADKANANSRIFINVNNTITGIQDEKAVVSDGQMFDLQGRRVEKPAKGLYIKGGKKQIAK